MKLTITGSYENEIRQAVTKMTADLDNGPIVIETLPGRGVVTFTASVARELYKKVSVIRMDLIQPEDFGPLPMADGGFAYSTFEDILGDMADAEIIIVDGDFYNDQVRNEWEQFVLADGNYNRSVIYIRPIKE